MSEAPPLRKKSILPLVGVTLVGAGAVLGAAFYQEHLTGYWTQQGWNPSAAAETIRTFARAANDPKQGAEAASLLDLTTFKAEVKDGRLVKVEHGQGIARRSDPPKALAPSPSLQEVKSELLVMNGGSYRVIAQFEDGKWGEYRVKRGPSGLKITAVPALYTPEPPPRVPSEY